jgi:hypothetical protein
VLVAVGVAGLGAWQLYDVEPSSAVVVRPVAVAGPQSTPHAVRARLGCLNDTLVAGTKATPPSVKGAFDECRSELRTVIGDSLGKLAEPDYFAIFASLVAHRWAPYGAGKGTSLEELKKQPVMQCAQYAGLTGQLLAFSPYSDQGVLRFVGVEGGAVMNHAQLFYTRGPTSLLLDPTIGLVAVATFDQVFRGVPVAPQQIFDFYDREEIATFRDRVVKALTQGSYRPSDLLYYFEGIDTYLSSNATSEDFLTPGGERLRDRQAAGQ